MRTEVTLNGICGALQRNCGDMYEACREVGVSIIFLEQWCKDDPKVAERVTDAARLGTMGLYSAAVKRAVVGVEEDVYYKGVSVGTKINYSDTLLVKLMAAKLPEFHKDADGSGGTNVTVNIANVMPRASNYEEWLAMKGHTLKPLPAPKNDDIIDVVADKVIENMERDGSLEALGRLMCEPSPYVPGGLADLL